MGLLSGSNNGSIVDTEAFMDSDLPQRVGRLLAMGLLVTIGTTRDRGAVMLQVTHDGERDREYFRDSGEAVLWLERIDDAAVASGLGESRRDPAPRQTPTRRRQKAV